MSTAMESTRQTDIGMDLDINMNEGEGDVLDEITNMESTFYQQGYQAGYDHGKLHGLFEGRELGSRGKGGRKGKDARALNHAQVLLSLIHSFPTTNPTPTPTPSQPNNTGTDEPKAEADLDLANLISNIRARYKLLCSSLNVKPRLQVAQIVEVDPRSGAGASGLDAGLDGPAKGVDTSQLRF
ncbi:hypothetical protein V865_004808 [Kwoniella europaea PYCC6329]|uniref:Essential protein Yae1 N-terminal domain-containing protein n=1 Tax=Kwoniella europaea PYCC6329 TaxID=1423913 RepID=A0AAX4KN49_9TREE